MNCRITESPLSVLLVYLVFVSHCICPTLASRGDQSNYFQNCDIKCLREKCQPHNHLLYKRGYEESFTDHLIFAVKTKKIDINVLENLIPWNCKDECRYQCVQKTSQAFALRDWPQQQFFGKWPFLRILGIQEPASVIFSALNLYVHFKGFTNFRKHVHKSSPMFTVWQTFSLICSNAWVWSMIFHARDSKMTEFFDYVFAYSMVLASFWCLCLRMLHRQSKSVVGFVSFVCALFYFNHFAYLSSTYSFDYSYNMQVNLMTGAIGGIGWILWCLSQIRKRFYVWKMIIFVILALVTTLLEVYDFPPVFKTFDAHSIWHLSSAPISIIFYNFITQDCIQLKKEEDFNDKTDKKKV